MPSLVKITASMFPELYDALLRELDPSRSESHWTLAFTRLGPCDENHFGYALTDGGKIVGMLGTMFSARTIRGNTFRFCNLHCWYVKPDYRARSLLLMKPVLDLKEHTLTDFTPSPGACAIAKRLGFSRLDRSAVVLPPLPRHGGRRRAATCEITDLAHEHGARMEAADLRIYQDHRETDCGHVLVRGDRAYSYIVYSRIDRHRLSHCLIHYVSDKQVFAEHHAVIRAHLMRQSNARYVVVDSRLLADVRVPWTLRIRANEQLYRSSHLVPREIDSLYSEMVCFKLSVFPSVRQRLREAARRCLPLSLVPGHRRAVIH